MSGCASPVGPGVNPEHGQRQPPALRRPLDQLAAERLTAEIEEVTQSEVHHQQEAKNTVVVSGSWKWADLGGSPRYPGDCGGWIIARTGGGLMSTLSTSLEMCVVSLAQE
jgi:hypothetical protein